MLYERKYIKQFNRGMIQAIQLLPEEVSPSDDYLSELEEVLDSIHWTSERDGSIRVTQMIGLQTDFFEVPPTHWIIRDEYGTIYEMSPEEFERKYQ